MISKNRKKIINTVTALCIVIILANILQTGTFSLAPLIVEDFFRDNLDEDINDTPDTVRTNNIESPIHIDDTNPECDWDWASTQAWCSGSGTPNYPYVIQDLTIDGGGSGSGILIENSDACFKIENCEVYNSGIYYMDAGIKLYNTNHGEIINNDCSNNNAGIYLDDSSYNVISGNTANNNKWYGIYLEDGNNNDILGNTANNNDYYGIALISSDENFLRNNNIGENYMGIILSSSIGNIIKENIFSDNSYGIILSALSGGPSLDNTIYLNEFYGSLICHASYMYYRGGGNSRESWDNGFIGNYWDDYTGVDDNDDGIGDSPYEVCNFLVGAIDNYPIWDDGPAHDGSPIYIDGNSDWEWASTQQWCSGSGTPDNPYVIKDLIIWGDYGRCIVIENSDVYFRIENCEVSAYDIYDSEEFVAGIILSNTKNGEIINCTSYWNYGDALEYIDAYGIYLENSDDNTISGNYVCENEGSDGIGIYLKYSDYNTISNNIASGNVGHVIGAGILLEESDNNIISGNTANDTIGYYAYGNFGNGIYLMSSLSNTISQNEVSGNSGSGIELWYCDYNTILENVANNNGAGGIFLSASSDNEIDDNEASYNDGCGIFLSQLSDWNYGGGNYLHDNDWLPLYDEGSGNSVSYYE